MSRSNKRNKAVLATALLANILYCMSVAYADDSEVFFPESTGVTQPNVLLMLDASGSMADPPKAHPTENSKISMLKNAVSSILRDKDTQGINIGMMYFNSPYPVLVNEVKPLDRSAPDLRGITIISSTSTTTKFRHDIVIGQDDGDQYREQRPSFNAQSSTIQPGYMTDVYTTAFRFNDIMLKNVREAGGSAGANNGLNSVMLSVRLAGTTGEDNKIDITVDPAASAKFLSTAENGFKMHMDGAPTPITCNLSRGGPGFRHCDVTSLLKDKIAQDGWENGNALTFFIKIKAEKAHGLAFSFSESGASQSAYLTIDANNKVVGKDNRTHRHSIIYSTGDIRLAGETPIVPAMLDAAQYLTNIKDPFTGYGPYHKSNKVSPLLDGCQATHLVLMSDGEPTENIRTKVANYIRGCYIDGVLDNAVGGESCGRALSYWLANTNQGDFPEKSSFIKTHTVSFDLVPGSKGDVFLQDIAKHGGGSSFNVSDTSGLVDAFSEIITTALIVDVIPMNAQVSISAQNKYEQRREAFYSLFQSDSYNYWAGNMKGFLIKYDKITEVNTGKTITQPVLYDKAGSSKAMSIDGSIIDGVSSFWSDKDGSSIDAGGVVGQLADDPKDRNLFTLYFGTDKYELSSAASPDRVGNRQLEVSNDDRRKGLLDFIRGYTYAPGGSNVPAPKKIGDSARSKVQLVTYGCDVDKKPQDCEFKNLKQVALLAGNDGFIRVYDVRTGKALHEYMHLDYLPLIQKLEERSAVSGEVPRFYGLDGSITYYHDDKNGNGYLELNNKETLFAYAVAGRGGRSLYFIELSYLSLDLFRMGRKIGHTSYGFEELGYTWSVPAPGKIVIDDKETPIIVFGGGYDTSIDTNPLQHKNSMGSVLYIVDGKSGDKLFSTSLAGYSVPSSVETVIDDNGYITDLFFGDVGGNLWHFKVNYNAKTNDAILTPQGKNGIVASISGSTLKQTRRFFHKPAVYKMRDENGLEVFTVNIGTGNQPHPLSTTNVDRFYSFRFPVNQTEPSGKVLTEDDLALVQLYSGNTTVENKDKLSNGFMFLLSEVDPKGNPSAATKGAKIVSEMAADFGRVVFNTFIPNSKTSAGSCEVYPGTQRTYVFNLLTGTPLLKSGYLETGVSGLPTDVALYCDTGFCTFVGSLGQLSGEVKAEAREDCQGADCMPFTVELPRVDKVRKTGWTDYFDPDPKPFKPSKS